MSTRPSRKRKIINYNDIESENSLSPSSSSSSSSSNNSVVSSKKKSKRKTKKTKTKTMKQKESVKRGEFSPKKQAFINKIKEILGDITLDEETENEIIKCVTGIYQEKEKDYLIEFIERKLKKFPMYKNDNDIIEKIINSNNDKNKIIILSGLPGVGKSTFSNNLQNYQDFDLLSLDSITTGIYFPKINKMEEYLFDKIKKEDKNYILDGTFLDYNEIVKLKDKVNKKTPDKFVFEIVYFNVTARFSYFNNTLRCVNEILEKGVSSHRRKSIPYPVFRGFKKLKRQFDEEIEKKNLLEDENFNIIETVDEIQQHENTYISPKFISKK